jgi:hypothetical protein
MGLALLNQTTDFRAFIFLTFASFLEHTAFCWLCCPYIGIAEMNPVQLGSAGAIASSSGSQLYRTVGVGSSAVNVFHRPSACSPRAALEIRSQATQTEEMYVFSGLRHPEQPPAFDSLNY